MVASMAMILMLVWCMGCSFIVEQPSTPLMFRRRRVQMLWKQVKTMLVFTWMGSFGAGTAKRTQLLSSNQSVVALVKELKRASLLSSAHAWKDIRAKLLSTLEPKCLRARNCEQSQAIQTGLICILESCNLHENMVLRAHGARHQTLMYIFVHDYKKHAYSYQA